MGDWCNQGGQTIHGWDFMLNPRRNRFVPYLGHKTGSDIDGGFSVRNVNICGTSNACVGSQ